MKNQLNLSIPDRIEIRESLMLESIRGIFFASVTHSLQECPSQFGACRMKDSRVRSATLFASKGGPYSSFSGPLSNNSNRIPLLSMSQAIFLPLNATA